MKSTFYESPKFSFVLYESDDIVRTSPTNEGDFTGNETDDLIFDDIIDKRKHSSKRKKEN